TMNRLGVAMGATWNQRAFRRLRKLLRTHRPDVLHCHNTFPQISPAAYYAAHTECVPVVQTLHNFRLLCPGGTFFRGGVVCEDCLHKTVAFPGVQHGCYRRSRPSSAVVAGMLLVHRILRTWERKVTLYVALTEFSRRKFIEGGLPADKIVTKPNFLSPSPVVGDGGGKYALFVGRLSPEKGLPMLLEAWKTLGRSLPLKIVGDGPLAPPVRQQEQRNPAVQWLGRLPSETVLDLMGRAEFLVFPSLWYEGLPRTIIEAFAKGTPVIASDLGAMAEIIRDRQTGLLHRPGDANDLSTAVQWALSHPAQLAAMRKAARAEFDARYTAERNYKMIMDLYQTAMARPRP
ncbi:MAG: glycosyltransferase, partial [Candidatus Hydrogenedentes bacterium]|nr:glycosyltransferase [Candidatus Hydrogenedentota bacterium]